MRAERTLQTGAGGRGGRCVHRADRRMDGRALTRRMGGRGGKGANGQADEGGKGADSRADGQTRPTRRGQADERTGGRAEKWSGGQVDSAVGASIVWTAGRADGRMGGLGSRGRKSRGRAN